MDIPRKNKKLFIREHAARIIEDAMKLHGNQYSITYDKLNADEKQAFDILISTYDYDRFS